MAVAASGTGGDVGVAVGEGMEVWVGIGEAVLVWVGVFSKVTIVSIGGGDVTNSVGLAQPIRMTIESRIHNNP